MPKRGLRRGAFALCTSVIITPIALAVGLLAPAANASPNSCGTRVASDFNGDGHADLAVGADEEKVNGIDNAGTVHILYGGSSGLSSAGNQEFDESSFGDLLTVDQDFFGSAVAPGFFNNDCYADLAIGVIAVGADGNQYGEIVVIYGSAGGLSTAAATVITDHEVQGSAYRPQDFFGYPMATGDINGDGYTDLAVSSVPADNNSGGVAILYGSSTGLTLSGHQFFTQDSAGVPGTGENGDQFGRSLAIGDFNGDGKGDLAIGSPGEGIGSQDFAGAITILKGTSAGLTTSGAKTITENTIGGKSAPNDTFGASLAAGDITGDHKADLLVGVPLRKVGSVKAAGAVVLLEGSSSGVLTTGTQTWTQNSSGVPGTAETADGFGISVTIGDFNGDGKADAAVGTPTEDVGAVEDAGSVTILYGRSTGLTGTGSTSWTQNSTGISGTSETNDMLGYAFVPLNITSTGHADLVTNVLHESSGGFTDNGAIAALYGGASGITAAGNQFFDSSKLAGGAYDDGDFGWSLG